MYAAGHICVCWAVHYRKQSGHFPLMFFIISCLIQPTQGRMGEIRVCKCLPPTLNLYIEAQNLAKTAYLRPKLSVCPPGVSKFSTVQWIMRAAEDWIMPAMVIDKECGRCLPLVSSSVIPAHRNIGHSAQDTHGAGGQNCITPVILHYDLWNTKGLWR